MKGTFRLSTAILLLAFNFVSSQSTPFNLCPTKCSDLKNSPDDWPHFHGKAALTRCSETTLFDTSLFIDVDDPKLPLTIRACTASEANTDDKEAEKLLSSVPFTAEQQDDEAAPKLEPLISKKRRSILTPRATNPGCKAGSTTHRNATETSFHSWKKTDNSKASLADVDNAVEKLSQWLSKDYDCKSSIMFARAGDAIVGIYIGAEYHKPSAAKALSLFSKESSKAQGSGKLATQICKKGSPVTWTIGIFADLSGDISGVQTQLKNWASGECIEDSDETSSLGKVEFDMIKALDIPIQPQLSGSETTPLEKRFAGLAARQTFCRPLKIVEGELCEPLAKRCGTTVANLQKFNGEKMCNSLVPGKHVCCTAGTMPDVTPQPNSDGTCKYVEVSADNLCQHILPEHNLTEDMLKERNKQTWAWAGCNALQIGQRICVSTGSPPLPAVDKTAVCGPQKPGTAFQAGVKLQDYNPCPLNVCCNVWGQCGLTEDFCTIAPGPTGNPGTTAEKKHSCINNCGMEITNNKQAPASFGHIAYFEAWNHNRPCLNMDVTDIDTKKYTHIHFSFGHISSSYEVSAGATPNIRAQFDKMKTMTGIKKIMSFGGWAFSVEAPTYNIFRQGVTAANRQLLVENCVKFVNDNNLDGIDFDWEYPAAPDLPDIPAGIIEEGQNYLEFLRMVKRRLPNKSVSIAAPASYWYLKGYPIKEIASVVDYIVYMTYDLHGQWDYGNKYSNPGCDPILGNCLRSHVNITETTTALAMVTKAGVPAHKVYVGIASYGRSFRKADPDCDEPHCRFTGTAKKSDAMPGHCTGEPGYIASAEIRDIRARELYSFYEYHDHASNSDIFVYNDHEWVAWMNDVTKATRIEWVKGLNFGGVSDWAVDLDKDYGSSKIGDEDAILEEFLENMKPKCDPKLSFKDLDALAAAMDSIPQGCEYVPALDIFRRMIDENVKTFESYLSNDYDTKFKFFQRYMNQALPVMLKEYMYFRVQPATKRDTGEGGKFFDCDFTGGGKSYKGACPVPDNRLPEADVGVYKLKYSLRDENGFKKFLIERGFDPNWIEYGTETIKANQNCPGSSHGQICVNGFEFTFEGMPKLKSGFKLPDPKEIFNEILPSRDKLYSEITWARIDLNNAMADPDPEDMVSVFSMQVFSLAQALDSMKEAMETGEEIREEEEKQTILMLIGMMIMFIPFLGQYSAAAAGLVNLGRGIAAFGAGASAGLTIYEIVQDPASAAMLIAELFMLGKIRSRKEFADAAKIRKDMPSAQRNAAGATFKRLDDKLGEIFSKACRR